MLLVEQEFDATWLHLGELCGRAYLEPACPGNLANEIYWGEGRDPYV